MSVKPVVGLAVWMLSTYTECPTSQFEIIFISSSKFLPYCIMSLIGFGLLGIQIVETVASQISSSFPKTINIFKQNIYLTCHIYSYIPTMET